MRVENRTKWRTGHLRAFVARVAESELDAEHRKRLLIRFMTARKYLSGYAHIRGSYVLIRLPPNVTEKKPRFCQILAHEFAHIRGAKGERWMRSKEDCRIGHGDPFVMYSWANDLPLERQPKAKSVKPGDDAKLAATETAIKKWESKLKRCQTALRKYRRQQKYYQSKMHAAACSANEARSLGPTC
jgi:hypothetical protein